MTEPDVIHVLNSETDAFRLVIRGHALIEEQLDAIIADAFAVGVTPFLVRLDFSRKVALLIGLGLVPQSMGDPISRLNKLRNDLAHGRLVEINKARAKDLVLGVGTVIPAMHEAAHKMAAVEVEGIVLSLIKVAIGGVWGLLAACESEAKVQRDRVARALAAVENAPLNEFFRLAEAARVEASVSDTDRATLTETEHVHVHVSDSDGGTSDERANVQRHTE